MFYRLYSSLKVVLIVIFVLWLFQILKKLTYFAPWITDNSNLIPFPIGLSRKNKNRSSVSNHSHDLSSYDDVVSDNTRRWQWTEQQQSAAVARDRGQKTPLIVIILAYMHTGSTHLGEVLHKYTGSFYEYEPLRFLQKTTRAGQAIRFLNGTMR